MEAAGKSRMVGAIEGIMKTVLYPKWSMGVTCSKLFFGKILDVGWRIN